MTNARFIAITGPAAAGKSTIAKALQTELIRRGELWHVMELDVFARGLLREWIKWGKHRGEFAERGFMYARGDDGRVACSGSCTRHGRENPVGEYDIEGDTGVEAIGAIVGRIAMLA